MRPSCALRHEPMRFGTGAVITTARAGPCRLNTDLPPICRKSQDLKLTNEEPR